MRNRVRIAGRVLLYLAGAVGGACLTANLCMQLCIQYEMRTTGALDRSELANDYGLPVLAMIWLLPALIAGAAAGLGGIWLLLRIWN